MCQGGLCGVGNLEDQGEKACKLAWVSHDTEGKGHHPQFTEELSICFRHFTYKVIY